MSRLPQDERTLRVKGPIKLVDQDGNEFKVQEDTIYICRCGGSANKPFCDGTHKKNDFDAPTRAA